MGCYPFPCQFAIAKDEVMSGLKGLKVFIWLEESLGTEGDENPDCQCYKDGALHVINGSSSI
jgi:hypothetical protein